MTVTESSGITYESYDMTRMIEVALRAVERTE